MTVIVRLLAVLALFAAPVALPAQELFFDAQGVPIHFITKGSGQPVVLIHGRGGSAESWRASGVFQDLAKDHFVIALDCRGHGTSGKPHDPAKYGREMALDVVRLLDHLQIFSAHVIGYSMGAMITAQLLTLHPERCSSAVLLAGAGRLQWTETEERFYEQMARETEKLGFSPSLTNRLAPIGTPPLTEGDIARRSAVALANPQIDAMAMAALTRSFRDQVITPAQAAAVKVPTLGIVGSEDPTMLEQLKKLRGYRPAMPLVIIDGAKHGDVSTRPEFLAAVKKFISDAASGTP